MSAQQRGRTRDYETEERISAAADASVYDANVMRITYSADSTVLLTACTI